MMYQGPEVEAIYNPSFLVLGMQWHPEMMRKSDTGYAASYIMLKDFVLFETSGFMRKYLPNVAKAYVSIKRGI
jgi:GMP synthase-like glutamine amidotransferase